MWRKQHTLVTPVSHGLPCWLCSSGRSCCSVSCHSCSQWFWEFSITSPTSSVLVLIYFWKQCIYYRMKSRSVQRTRTRFLYICSTTTRNYQNKTCMAMAKIHCSNSTGLQQYTVLVTYCCFSLCMSIVPQITLLEVLAADFFPCGK